MDIKSVAKRLYTHVMASSFLKSVMTLSSGVVIGQAISFFGMPVVGRVYDPAAIGDYTLITTNAGIISSVACLGMMTVFMLPESHEEARGLSRLVTCSTALITTLAILGLWFCQGIYRIFNTEETAYAVSLLVLWLYIVFNTVSNICYAYVNRHKLYRVMFWNPIITAGVNVGAGIVFGLLGFGFVGYTLAHILSFAVNIFHLARHANPYEKVSDPVFRFVPLLKNYRRFPLYQMPANLISSVGNQIPVQLIEGLYTSTALGMYSMAIKILSLPASLLATPINRVYFREASERYNRGEDIGEFSFRILKANIKIAIIPIVLLILFGEWIFAVFLGEKWRQAGTFAAILGVYYLIQFCNNCLSGGFVIIRKNKFNLYTAIYQMVSSVVLYGVVVYLKPGVEICLVLLAASGILTVLTSQGILFWLTGIRMHRYLGFVFKYIFLPTGAAWLLRALIW